MGAETITATAYLVVKATRKTYGQRDPETNLMPVESARVTAARQSRPRSMAADEVLVKVAVQLPAAAFDPISPSALIVVPGELVLARHEIQVEASNDDSTEPSL